METNHVESTRKTEAHERPAYLPYLTAEDFCKAKYSHNDMRCYTARLLDIFLDERKPYVAAYREFRLKTMDVLYKHFKDDHASTGADRARVFNTVANSLNYQQINMPSYIEWWALELQLNALRVKKKTLHVYVGHEGGGCSDVATINLHQGYTFADEYILNNIGNRLHNISCSLQETNKELATELERMALTIWGK